MSGKNILVYFVLLFCIFHQINSVELKCEYTNVGEFYDCNVKNNPSIVNPFTRVEIEEKGHQGGQKNQDVTRFIIVNKTMKYFPIGLEDFFPNLQDIHIENTGLEEINQKDLEPFSKLTRIDIINNPIQEIPKDLFKFNLELYEIKFFNNTNLRYIHPKVFDNLQKLTIVNMRENGFPQISIASHNKVQSDLVRDIKKYCMKEEYRMELFVEEMNATLNELQPYKAMLNEMEQHINSTLIKVKLHNGDDKFNSNDLIFHSIYVTICLAFMISTVVLLVIICHNQKPPQTVSEVSYYEEVNYIPTCPYEEPKPSNSIKIDP